MAKKKTLYMETTKIDTARTAAEVCAELVKAGADQIATRYSNGEITGLRWSMKLHGRDVLFEMPARVEPVFKHINSRRSSPRHYADKDLEQAHRVAWRQLLRWVQSQLAMIDTGMVETAEVFAPYIVAPDGRTVWQMLRESQFMMLPAPTTKQ